MDPLQIIQDIINRAKKIYQLALKPSIDTNTETYFVAIQRDGQEAERIDLTQLPVSVHTQALIDALAGSVAISKRVSFTVTATEQSNFNVGESFNSLDVFSDRVYQIQGVDYNINGNVVEFTTPQPNASRVDIRIHTSTDTAITNTFSFTATAGQTVFDLGQSFDTVEAYLDRVYQISTVDYNTSGNNVTFTSALPVGSKVNIRTFGT